METLQLLGTALGLGALAGINLYLTVFVSGLAIQQGWITLAPQYHQLGILAHPAVIVIAGVFYFLQFFADKVPWVDSLWDLVHSVIRPIGAAFLAVQVLGDSNAAFDVIIALLSGGVALSTHTLKAGTRLIANSSPEPISNIVLSVTEDAAVVGGLLLIQTNPILALLAVILLVAAIVYFGPKIARAVRTKVWLAWRKLNSPAGPAGHATHLPTSLPANADILLHTLVSGTPEIAWSVPCIAAGSKRIKGNAFGHLVALKNETDRLYFIGTGRFRRPAKVLDLSGYKASHESKFLSENLHLYAVDRRPQELFFFERSHRHLVARLAEELSRQLTSAPESRPPSSPAEVLPPLGQSVVG